MGEQRQLGFSPSEEERGRRPPDGPVAHEGEREGAGPVRSKAVRAKNERGRKRGVNFFFFLDLFSKSNSKMKIQIDLESDFTANNSK